MVPKLSEHNNMWCKQSVVDEYLSVMREKDNLVCHYFHRFAYIC